MNKVLHFLIQHGYAVLFGSVLAEQVGLPLPAVPFLLAMGALCGLGHFSLSATVVLAVCACLVGDVLWFYLGRAKGNAVLKLLCRISLEPDSCVNDARGVFQRRGARTLIVAKFVPGLSTVAPPMAGVTRMALGRFLWADALGSLLWVAVYLTIGYLFKGQIERVGDYAENFGSRFGTLVVVLLAAWLAWKYYQRRRFLRTLRVARITPNEVFQRMQTGDAFAILDMRHQTEGEDVALPGALHIRPDELEHRHEELPRDRDIILYCT